MSPDTQLWSRAGLSNVFRTSWLRRMPNACTVSEKLRIEIGSRPSRWRRSGATVSAIPNRAVVKIADVTKAKPTDCPRVLILRMNERSEGFEYSIVRPSASEKRRLLVRNQAPHFR